MAEKKAMANAADSMVAPLEEATDKLLQAAAAAATEKVAQEDDNQDLEHPEGAPNEIGEEVFAGDFADFVEVEEGAEEDVLIDADETLEADLAEEAPSAVIEDAPSPVSELDSAQTDAHPEVDLLQAFERQLGESAADMAHDEDLGMAFDDFVEVDDDSPEGSAANSPDAPEGESTSAHGFYDLGDVMDQVDPALLAQMTQAEGLAPQEPGASAEAGAGPQLDEILSERFGGATTAREFLMSGGVEALRESVRAANHSLGIAPTELRLNGVQPNGPAVEDEESLQHRQQNQQQQFQPQLGGIMAGLVGGLAGAAAGLTVGMFNGMSKLAVGAAKGGTQAYQGYIDKRNSRDFEQRLADVESLVSEMNQEGANLLDGPIEERIQFFQSERMAEIVKRFSAATDALEQSAARKLAQGLKGGAEPTDLMRQTAERVADFAERNKKLLEGLQSGGTNMLERFDGITNNLFSALKDILVRLARMVMGGGQQPGNAPEPAPASGPSMR